jgi:hypothetical protein
VPGEMLRMIEDAANEDPVQIQKGFTSYDECSNISKIFLNMLCKELRIKFCIEYDDECVTAAETYSCGREKEPGIVDLIFNTEKGNATIVQNALLYLLVSNLS